MQPCNVTVDDLSQVYVVDTGNSRIKKLTSNLDFIDHVTNEGLEGRSTTGICMGSSRDSLIVINWRTKTVTEMTLDGNTIGNYFPQKSKILIPDKNCHFYQIRTL